MSYVAGSPYLKKTQTLVPSQVLGIVFVPVISNLKSRVGYTGI